MKRKKRPGPSSKDLEPTANNDQDTTTNSDSKGKVGRRGFLKIGAGAAAVTLANPLESIAEPRNNVLFQTSECNDVPFSEPKPVYAQIINGQSVLQYDLSAEPLKWTFACPNQTTPTTGLQPVFNGALPGPSMYVDPGTTLNLSLKNNLNAMPPFSGDNCPGNHHLNPPKPACFQHTNMHFHGFQVSPCSLDSNGNKHCGPYDIDGKNPPLKCSSDDVLVDVFPGQTNQYCVVLPDMHAPGTNWYHSHLHGASAYQVSGGMAGAIIIREPPGGQIVRDDLDKVFVLQEIIANPPSPWPTFPPVYGSLGPGGGGPGTQVFVNGLCRPTLKMNAGQNMRFRFINIGATPRTLTKLRLVKTTTCSPTVPPPPPSANDQVMWLMAIDGLSFYGINPQPVRYHLMGNGNRADFLINLQPGLYTLYKDAYPLQSVLNPSSTTPTVASNGSRQVLMYLDVQASPYQEQIPKVIPGKKPAYLDPIWNVDTVRQQPIQFQNTATKTFMIDNNFYDMNTPISVKLNTAEEWTLQNVGFAASPGGQSNAHPFHVHLNPFQILGVSFDFEVSDADLQKFGLTRMNPSDPCTWPFWDTVPLPGAAVQNGAIPTTTLKVRSRFLIYDGEYVSHCHILVHEDVGMMINVKLIGNGVGPNVPVHTYPADAAACIQRTSRCPGDTPP
ncbi:MAG TPA: multicopper oxidase domain-containing protein [Pyrinomonadaceae bacterium]|nr:multicopper oxidase domain-containing protein [Pyrinomonadaceae bacterium]